MYVPNDSGVTPCFYIQIQYTNCFTHFQFGSIAAVFGPESTASANHAAIICDEKEIPFIETRWDYEVSKSVVNLYPSQNSLAKLLLDVVVAFEWESFTIVYESASWLPRVSELLKMYGPKDGHTVTVRQLNTGSRDKDYRSVFGQIKRSEDTNIVVECSIEILQEVLLQVRDY